MTTKQVNPEQDLVQRIRQANNAIGPVKADNDKVLKVLDVIDSYIIKDAEEGNRNEVDNPFYESNTTSYIKMNSNTKNTDSNPVLITPENTDSFGYLKNEFSNQILPNSTDEIFNYVR